MHPPLPLPENIPPIQQLAARATHWGLYSLLVVQPFVGWVATSAYRAPIMCIRIVRAAADLASGPSLVPRACLWFMR